MGHVSHTHAYMHAYTDKHTDPHACAHTQAQTHDQALNLLKIRNFAIRMLFVKGLNGSQVRDATFDPFSFCTLYIFFGETREADKRKKKQNGPLGQIRFITEIRFVCFYLKGPYHAFFFQIF